MYKLYCRTYQAMFRVTSHFLPWRKPELIEGENCLSQLPKLIKNRGVNRVLIVSDKGITSPGLMENLLIYLESEGISFALYDNTAPNPTITHIEEALEMYNANHCEGIIAFGGGSPMDCAKGVGARVAKPHLSIPQMRGVLKIRKQIPFLCAVPTTAGTGSEAMVAAVITNSETHEKYAINDMALIPHFAVLDPILTINLPPHITSTTGIDALTHAIEAYIGRSNT